MWLLPGVALACAANEKQVFACTTMNAKAIEICQTPTELIYIFGKKGQKPEMRIATPNQKVEWIDDGGMQTFHDSLIFRNGKTTYTLGISYDRLDQSEFADLTVASGDKQLALIECTNIDLAFKPDQIKAEKQAYSE